jgi:hypothetical protein
MRNAIGYMTLAIVAAFLLAAAPVMAQAPNTISYQGRLTQPDGVTPITTEVSVLFSIYAAESGGSALWSTTLTFTPEPTGVFTRELGPIPANVFDGTKRYLGIKVGADTEMIPRQLLTAAPYSFSTSQIPDNSVTTAKIAAGAVGTGQIANDAITTAKIAAGGVGNADIAADAVTTAKILDGSVGNADIAADAVTASKIADEPGFSQEAGETNTTYALTGTGQSFASVTLNAPASGYALVIGSAVSWVVHTSGQWDNNIFTVSKTSGDVSSANYGLQIVTVPSVYPTSATEFRVPVVIHHVFSVTAGSNTFYLNGYDSNNTGDDKIFRPRITAIFLPSLYGIVTSAAVETGGDKTLPDLSTNNPEGM